MSYYKFRPYMYFYASYRIEIKARDYNPVAGATCIMYNFEFNLSQK